jgi:hypothetical protein
VSLLYNTAHPSGHPRKCLQKENTSCELLWSYDNRHFDEDDDAPQCDACTQTHESWSSWRKAVCAFRRARKIASSYLFVYPSVRLYGTTRFPLDGFPLNLISEFSSKIYQENSSFIKIRHEQRVLLHEDVLTFTKISR